MTSLDKDIVNHPYQMLCLPYFICICLAIAILINLGLAIKYTMISLTTKTDLPQWLLVVTLPLLIIAVVILFRSNKLYGYIALASKLTLVYNDTTARFAKIYFYGYPLAEAIQAELFARLSQWRSHTWAGGGYCYETAALVMFSLHGAKTARICYGRDQTGADHAWVEYRYLGTWWVIDLVWHSRECAIYPRKTYYQLYRMRIEKTVSYQEFWQGPHASLYEILTDPNSVDQRHLLMHLSRFRPAGDYGLKDNGIIDRDGWRTLPNGAKVPYVTLLDDLGIGKPENIDRLMTDPNFYPAIWQEVKV